MPLGAARITLLAKTTVAAVAEVIRKKVGVSALGSAVSISTTQSKFGGASAYFNAGASDQRLVAYNAADEIGTGDFTLETWYRADTFTSTNAITYISGKAFYVTSAGKIAYYDSAGFTGTTTMSTGTWYHLCWQRNGDTIRLFVDGNLETSAVRTTNFGANALLGCKGINDQDMNGYLDEYRLSKTARYPTTGFTPDTTPFVNDANTLLLLHMDGTDGSTFFEDDNGVRASNGITAFNGAQVDTAQSKFGGASAYFDGVDDYIRVYDPEDKFNFGTGDFTLEFWYKKNTTNATEQIACNRTGYTTGNWYIQFDSTTDKIQWGVYGGTAQRSTNTFDDTNWHHLAITRNAGDFTLWIDGSSENTYNGTSYVWGRTADPFIDFAKITTGYGNLWIDEVRISNNVRYTTGFTPSTTPFVNDSNTLLLLHMDGTDAATDFRDDNGKDRSAVGISAVGNAQVDTAQSKFGGSSLLLDGTVGTRLDIEPRADYIDWDDKDLTIDAWIYVTDLSVTARNISGNYVPVLIGNQLYNGGNNQWSFGPTPLGGLNFYYYAGGQRYVASSTGLITTNTWYHIAMVHNNSANNITLYLNGTQVAQESVIGTLQHSLSWFNIGAYNNIEFKGSIDELRISDSARYTAGFTPDTTPFQNDANTLLLLHMDGTDGSTTFLDDNGTYTV